MKIYSDYPARRILQILVDILAVALIWFGIWLGSFVGSAIATAAEVGRQLESAGAGFRGAMTDVAGVLENAPFIGTAIRQPFDAASGTGGILESMGQTTASFITTTAFVVGVVVGAVIVLAVGWFWLTRRIRFARRATQASRLAKLDDGPDLLALRALVTGTRTELAAADARPVEAWRSGDLEAIRRLAGIELRRAGVRIAG